VVMPVFALPLGRGRYRMIYEHPVEPPRADSDDAIREFTQRCTDVLEMYVRRHPEYWLWMHRRWRDAGPAADGVPGVFPSADHDVDARLETGEEWTPSSSWRRTGWATRSWRCRPSPMCGAGCRTRGSPSPRVPRWRRSS